MRRFLLILLAFLLLSSCRGREEALVDAVWAYSQAHPDGFTLDVHTLTEPREGIAVSYAATQDSHAREALGAVVRHALLHEGYVGGWLNPSDSLYFFDSVRLFPEDSLEAAIRFGLANGQRSVFDLSTGEDIPLESPLPGDWAVSPLPREIRTNGTAAPFHLTPATTVCVPRQGVLHDAGARFAREYALQLSTRRRSQNAIVLAVDPSVGKDLEGFRREECYRISSGAGKLTIAGATERGVLHGLQTLSKALHGASSLPAGEVFDYPEYPYRGFMLDCARHFFPAYYIKQLIDILALHQLNYFHWHLSDDQGWRLEIKRWPRLTEVGSIRAGSPAEDGTCDGVPVSGFYTQAEAREIVAYAAERGITVIPEIDLPGHMLAALAAYPELGCTGGPYEVATCYGVLEDVLCAGKESSRTFIREVLEEVMDVFPSEYIHLGGDECPKERWEQCPFCQERIRELGLSDEGGISKENRLQSALMAEAEAFLAEHGRRMIGWNDILCDWGNAVCGAPSRSTTIAAWMRPESAAIAAREGYPVIVCPVGYLYFSNAAENRRTGLDALQRVYELPLPEELTEEERARIIGLQACIWTERVADTAKLEWELLPRLSTLAELQWADPARHGLEAYLPRLYRLTRFYTSHGWRYRQDLLPQGQ